MSSLPEPNPAEATTDPVSDDQLNTVAGGVSIQDIVQKVADMAAPVVSHDKWDTVHVPVIDVYRTIKSKF